jgi:dUTPase
VTRAIVARAAERLLYDLGFAAPEAHLLHIERRMEELVEEALDERWQWLREVRQLQERTFGYDFAAIAADSAELAKFLTWNAFAAFVEVAEASVEFSWAPWARDEPFANRERIRDEVIDVLHFLGNALVAIGVDDEELAAAYSIKDGIIRSREASGRYSKQKGSLGEGSEVAE